MPGEKKSYTSLPPLKTKNRKEETEILGLIKRNLLYDRPQKSIFSKGDKIHARNMASNADISHKIPLRRKNDSMEKLLPAGTIPVVKPFSSQHLVDMDLVKPAKPI